MSGHSKWANIKRQKQANDMVRGKAFSKLSRLITLTVLEGGGITDPEHNIKLRLAVEKARQSNMPKENIQRAIEKGTGPGKELLKEVIYEAFGPLGVGFIIIAATDNMNRTSSEIRNMLERHGGKLGSQGSVLYLFQRCGVVVFQKKNIPEQDVFKFSEDLQALDIDEDDSHYSIYIPFENLGKIKLHLKDFQYDTAEIDYKPSAFIAVESEQTSRKIVELVNTLEELDDVHKVYTNAEIPEEYLK